MSTPHILLLDDEPAIPHALARTLRRWAREGRLFPPAEQHGKCWFVSNVLSLRILKHISIRINECLISVPPRFGASLGPIIMTTSLQLL